MDGKIFKLKELIKRNPRVVLCFFYFVQGIVFASWASRIPDIKNILSLSEATLGGILFSIPVGQMVTMVLAAWLIKRYGSRKMLTISVVLSPLSLVIIGFASSIIELIAVLLFFSVAANLYNIALNTQGVNVEKMAGRNIMATCHGMWSLGGFVGALLSMLLTNLGLSPLEHFLVILSVTAPLGLALSCGLVSNDVKPEVDATQGDVKRKRGIDSYIMLLGVVVFCAFISEGCMYDWSGIYFEDIVKAPDSLVRLGYIVCMSTMAIGRFSADYMVNRFGAAMVVRTCGLLIATGMLLSVAFPTLVVATIGFLLIGLGISSTVPICFSLAGRSKSMSASAAIATVSSIGCFGFLLGPPVIGVIAEAITLRWTFAIVAMIGIGLAIVAPRLKGNDSL